MLGPGWFRWVVITLVLLIITTGRLHAQANDGPIGQVQQPIVTGTEVDEADRERLGLLTLVNNCSASLLDDSWAITASHCLSVAQVRNPATVALRASWGTGQQLFADRIYRFWGTDKQATENNPDLALIHVSTPFTVNGSDRGFHRDIDPRSLSELVGTTLNAYGRGLSTYAKFDVNGSVVPGLIDGIYRTATLTVSAQSQGLYSMLPNSDRQIIGGGDSGGPSLAANAVDGVERLVGVHANCGTLACLPMANCRNADGTWNWPMTTAIGFCRDTAVGGRIALAIADLMNQDWDPSRSVQTISAVYSETYVRPEMDLYRLDDLGWASVQRTAQRMCVNRGFAAGLATGRRVEGFACDLEIPDDSFDIVCLNETTLNWFDAKQPEVDASGYGFGDINQVGWAQAARAANGVCQSRYPGSPGGMFTGFTASFFKTRLMGVFCLNAADGHWADALLPELRPDNGNLVDLNATNWATAARAANDWCQQKGYPGGGFFNGHQLEQKRGTICVGPRTSDPDARFDTSIVVTYPPSMIYAVTQNGDLLWYENFQSSRPGGSRDWYGPRRIDAGWQRFRDAFSDGGNALYAVADDGTLWWFGHEGYYDGSARWKAPEPVLVGSGWNGFRQIVPMGEHILYGIKADGSLLWYRHAGGAVGSNDWEGPKTVGSGWQNFKSVFAGGDGVLYAIQQDGVLLRYLHTGYKTGDASWEGPQKIGTGWDGFSRVFAGVDGVIYGVKPDGKLLWYRYGPPRPSERTQAHGGGIGSDFNRDMATQVVYDLPRWEGPVEVGNGWQRFSQVFPLMPNTVSVVH